MVKALENISMNDKNYNFFQDCYFYLFKIPEILATKYNM